MTWFDFDNFFLHWVDFWVVSIETVKPCFEPLNVIERNELSPRAERGGTEVVFKYRFTATVYNFLPIARFILGLPGQVKIIEPYALVEDIQNKMKKFIVFWFFLTHWESEGGILQH